MLMVQLINNKKFTEIKAEDFAIKSDTLVCELATKELALSKIVLPGYYLALIVVEAGESVKDYIGRYVVVTGDTKVFPAEFDANHMPVKFFVKEQDTYICDLESKVEANKIIS